MEVTVNGKRRQVGDGISVAELLAQLEMRPEVVHVQVNGEMVERSRYADVTLKEGDEVDIVMSMGGGGRVGLRP